MSGPGAIASDMIQKNPCPHRAYTFVIMMKRMMMVMMIMVIGMMTVMVT